MFGYRRKRSLGCEQLEGRFAPSSFWVGGGSRSTFKDAQALDTIQAEQAAFYLAASTVLGQASSVAKIEPVSGVHQSMDLGATTFVMSLRPDGTIVCGGVRTGHAHILERSALPESTDGGVGTDGQIASDIGDAANMPSVDPVSTATPTEQGTQTESVGATSSEQQPAGVAGATVEDSLAATDCPPVEEPSVEDGDVQEVPATDDGPMCGNDFEDLGPVVYAGPDAEATDPDTDASVEYSLESEPQSSDAVQAATSINT